jgi:hypothetical protein
VGAELVAVGGPTHAHGISHESTRQAAVDVVADGETELSVDPDAEHGDLGTWLASIEGSGMKPAAFDTRVDMAAALIGRASKGISRRLRHRGFDEVVEPESFLVTKKTQMELGEVDRAREWGRRLAMQMAAVGAR